MKRIFLVLIATWAAIVLSSCSWNRMKTNTDDRTEFYHKLKRIAPGKTIVDDLPVLLGFAPLQIIPQKTGGRLFVYQVGDAKTKGLMLIVVNFSVTNSASEMIYIYSSEKGVVTKVVAADLPRKVEWEFWPFGD